MAESLRDYFVNDFSGGLVLNKSDYQRNKNEFKILENFDIDDRGRLTRRKGFQRFGDDPIGAGNLVAGFTFWKQFNTSLPTQLGAFVIFDNSSNSNAFVLISASLTANVSPGDSSITVTDTTNFAASGTIEINGDLITYTSKTNATTLAVTGSTILKEHLTGSGVRQWSGASSSGLDARSGIYNAALIDESSGGLLNMVGGRGGSASTADGVSFTPRTTNGANMFHTTYRQRVYAVGDGAASANSRAIRVSFSDAGDLTTWDADNNFDVNENRGEPITALRALNDNLLIFKLNSTHVYNEDTLKQTSDTVGAFNNQVVQTIDNKAYTFCPTGVYVTTGGAFERISDPIAPIIKQYYPKFETTYGRVIDNCFATVYDKKYILHFSILKFPEADRQDSLLTKRNFTLVYDTVRNTWTTYTFKTDSVNEPFVAFVYSPSFPSGGGINGAGTQTAYQVYQPIEASFALGAGTVFRLFDGRERSYDTGFQIRGGDFVADNISNSAGIAISAFAETGFIDHGNPSWWKKYGYLRPLVDEGDFDFSYQLDKGVRTTDPISLGNFTPKGFRKRIPRNEGNRINILINSNTNLNIPKLNGFIIEDSVAIDKESRKYAEGT